MGILTAYAHFCANFVNDSNLLLSIMCNCGPQHMRWAPDCVWALTHSKGPTLDLITSNSLNVSKVVVTDAALFAHSCVYFEMTISVHTNVQS